MIYYKCAMYILSSTGLHIDFLCILLCGTPIFRDFENSFTKRAPKFVNHFIQQFLLFINETICNEHLFKVSV